MTAQEFDRCFDDGEDITPFIDRSTIRRPAMEAKRVNVDFPKSVIPRLDLQSKLIGVSRQSQIKLWISERIQQEQEQRGDSDQRFQSPIPDPSPLSILWD